MSDEQSAFAEVHEEMMALRSVVARLEAAVSRLVPIHQRDHLQPPAATSVPEKDWSNLMGTERMESKVKW